MAALKESVLLARTPFILERYRSRDSHCFVALALSVPALLVPVLPSVTGYSGSRGISRAIETISQDLLQQKQS